MSRLPSTIVINAFAGFWLVPFGLLVPPDRAAAQTAPSAPAATKQQNTIASGSATLPAADAAVERAAKEMAEAALNLWAALTPELQAKCAFPFDNNERFNWHFIP